MKEHRFDTCLTRRQGSHGVHFPRLGQRYKFLENIDSVRMLSNTLCVLIVFAFCKAERRYLGKTDGFGMPLSTFLFLQSTSSNHITRLFSELMAIVFILVPKLTHCLNIYI